MIVELALATGKRHLTEKALLDKSKLTSQRSQQPISNDPTTINKSIETRQPNPISLLPKAADDILCRIIIN